MVPIIGLRALIMENQMEKKMEMKWKLGLYRGYLCSMLFGDIMVPTIE